MFIQHDELLEELQTVIVINTITYNTNVEFVATNELTGKTTNQQHIHIVTDYRFWQ